MSEACLNCGKIWGDHYDGDFCNKKHSQVWRAPAPPAEGGEDVAIELDETANEIDESDGEQAVWIALGQSYVSNTISAQQHDAAGVYLAALSQRVRELEEENRQLRFAASLANGKAAEASMPTFPDAPDAEY